MDIKKTYADILQGLKLGGRGLVKLSNSETKELHQALKVAVETKSPKELEEILCILSHDQNYSPEFTPDLIKILEQDFSKEILVYTLSALVRHDIQANQRQGERVKEETLKILQKLLDHTDPEVVEWVLRTIDEMGTQGMFYWKKLKEIKPHRLSGLVNKHKRNVVEIIEMLERRWESYGKK
ncbi:MAG: HEAT repeat domain-containing protein [Bacteriovoracaceae bacterium]